MIKYLISMERGTKKAINAFFDTIVLASIYFIFIASLNLSFDKNTLIVGYVAIVLVYLCFATAFGLYRSITRYMGLSSFWNMLSVILLCTTSLHIYMTMMGVRLPTTYLLAFLFTAMACIGLPRMVFFYLCKYMNVKSDSRSNILIYGAGSAGVKLLSSLKSSDEFRCIAFIDDDESLHGAVISGVKVISPADVERIIKKANIDKILLAIPSVLPAAKKKIIAQIEPFPVEIKTVPSLFDIVHGNASFGDLLDVRIEDLLGREPVQPDLSLMGKNITGKVVMVTGAGGSIGSELCRQILAQTPTQLILYEVSEFALYRVDREFTQIVQGTPQFTIITPLLGSVQNLPKMEEIMTCFNVDTVYHAAAYKHVPLVENNIIEGVRNNIFGSMYAAQAALKAEVDTFVMVSTDKAVRPTNVMGATKRMAEMVVQSLAAEHSTTCFSMVRFGNVLGSSGSVIPLFKEQISNGGPVTLTHKDITRYFMTIPEAAQLVIQAGAMSNGGEVFVLDMGESVKIADLAERLIKLSGYTIKSDKFPDGDIEIITTGLRPGEKLYEELLIGDDVNFTEHQRIMIANEPAPPWEQLQHLMHQLEFACHQHKHDVVRQILIDSPSAYVPNDPIHDLAYLKMSS